MIHLLKKNRTSIYFFLICCLLIAGFTAKSQTASEIKGIQRETNVDMLLRMSAKAQKEQKANWQKALKIAKEKGWAIEEETKNKYRKLVGITPDLQPIYHETLNHGAGQTIKTSSLYSGGDLGLNLHGESMTAGVWDVAKVRVTHEAFKVGNQSRVMNMDSIYSNYWHSTHVTGTIIASDGFRSDSARGMAFRGNVHAYYSGADTYRIPFAVSQGLLISNHSYSSPFSNSGYNSKTSFLDSVAYYAPYYLGIWACGNSGGPKDKLNAYSTGKNVLAVANTHEVLFYNGPGSVIASSASSRGPSDDGRIKPDVAAKGENTFSTLADSDNSYDDASGTSMAAPSVAGTLLLLQQHYHNLNGRFMKAASLKGLAIHTVNEAGPADGPDIVFGWGLMNAERAAKLISSDGYDSLIKEDSLVNGNTKTLNVFAGSSPLTVTLSWTDLPATEVNDNVTTPRLINDLDLRVTNGAGTTMPWKLDPSNVTGAAIRGDNVLDNVEKVEVVGTVPGDVYTITISHKGTLLTGKQKYSLIVSGLGFDPVCVQNDTITAPTTTPGGNGKQAAFTITAINTVNTATEAVYHAGEEVVMKDGFTALTGSSYRAYIEGCSNNFPARLALHERAVVAYDIPEEEVEEIALPDNAVFPNPSTGIFNVSLEGLKEGTVELFGQDGNRIVNKKFRNQKELSLNIKSQMPGIYFVKVLSGSKVLTKKIVKE